MRLASRLVVFDYLTSLLGGNATELRDAAKKVEPGRRGDGQSNYFSMFDSWGARVSLDRSQLAEYDMNVLAIEERLGRHRSGFQFTYFQYLAALYSEIYLHRLAKDPSSFLTDLREHRNRRMRGLTSAVKKEDLRKSALWMATGSGKTILAHVNLIQFEHYQPFEPDNILFVTPSPTLSTQHLEALAQSGIRARHALTAGDGADVQVLEITKLYVDNRDGESPRGGDSLPTSAFEGQNLLLVDEGHKGSATRTDAAEERKWRDIREALAGELGFTFEYSATFAQITETDDELLDEYSKAITFDYGYKHFWEDGYGKDYRVVNLKKEGAYDTDELLLAGLLVLYEQARYFRDHHSEVSEYNIEKPLMVFVGATVTGAVESEVQQIVGFLDRVLREPDWASQAISRMISGNSTLPSDLFTHRFPYLSENPVAADAIYEDLCRLLFHGSGRLEMHMLQRGEGEIGLRTADAARDTYCGVINVGDASGFMAKAEGAGIARGEDDHITESVFSAIDAADSAVSFLIGSKKFIEGWSSWRVSVMGLLKVGKSAGPQVIQLFGRGVRLKGKGMGLKRSGTLSGQPPPHLHLLETLHIFGLKADYMEAFNEMVRRETLPERRELPITIRDDLEQLGLQAPDPGEYNFYVDEVVTFAPQALRDAVDVNLMPTFTSAEGVGEHETSRGSGAPETLNLPLDMVDVEALYLDLLSFKRRRGWYNTYITRDAVRGFLRDKVTVTAPQGTFAVASGRTRQLAQSAGEEALRKGLERFVYVQQRTHETGHLVPMPVTSVHANFPLVRTDAGVVPGYQLAVPEHLVRKVDELIAELAAGTAVLEDLTEPLPRLHVPAHLYNPVLVKESDVDEGGQQRALFHEVEVRSVPSGLIESEVRFLRDLSAFWETALKDPVWADHEISLLRNLPRKGVGFFATAGFYPDFMLWLKKGDSQALAFVEPHGMVIWDQMKVDLLRDIRGLGLSVPTVAYIVTPTSQRAIGAVGGRAVTGSWLRDRYILMQKEPDYVRVILEDLRRALGSVEEGQYEEGRSVGRFRLVDGDLVDNEVVPDADKFSTHAPSYSIRAAAGTFGSGEAADIAGWLAIDGPLTKDHFVVTAAGKSMEPLIRDGDLLLFRRYQGGTRQGMIVLAQWVGPEDPETGGSYAVKRYHRVGERRDEGLIIELRSENPEYESIRLSPRYEDEVAVLAEFVEVLRSPR